MTGAAFLPLSTRLRVSCDGGIRVVLKGTLTQANTASVCGLFPLLAKNYGRLALDVTNVCIDADGLQAILELQQQGVQLVVESDAEQGKEKAA